MTCPMCQERELNSRQKFCSDRCRQRAYRIRGGERVTAAELAGQRRRRREIDPLKMRARNAIGNRLRRGLVQRGLCEVCGDPLAEGAPRRLLQAARRAVAVPYAP